MKFNWKTGLILFSVSIILFSFPLYYSHQPSYSNTLLFSSGNRHVKAYPENLSIGYFQSQSGEIKFQVDSANGTPFSVRLMANESGWTVVYSARVIGYKYYQFSIDLPVSFINQGRIELELVINNETHTYFELSASRTLLPYALDIMFYSSLISAFLGFSFIATSRRLFLVPVALLYSSVAVFFGQRYDLFFMISSGFRLIHSVDPYIASSQLPGPLKWAYPPVFPYFSALVDRLAFIFNPSAMPSNQSLNYIGVIYGNLYSAWKALRGLPLYELYSAIKVPMVLSVFGIYAALSKMSPLKDKTFGLWLLNPAVILIGVAWGQLDVIAAFCMVMSLYYYRKGNISYSIALASAGAIIKIFPVFLIPYLLISSRHRLRDLIITVSILSVVLVLYYIVGDFSQNISTLVYSRTSPTFNGVFFVNGLSWEVFAAALKITEFPSLFIYGFIPLYAVLIILYWRFRIALDSFLVMTFLLFFLTYNIVNPQYMIYPILIYLVLGRRWEALALSVVSVTYVALSSTLAFFLNPELSYNYLSSVFGQAQNSIFSSEAGNILLYMVIAASNALFIYLISREISTIRRGRNLFAGKAGDSGKRAT